MSVSQNSVYMLDRI